MGVVTQYETDYYAWTQEQAALLRAGKLDQVDISHLIEEMENMGASERRELLSRLGILLGHLLKWQYQPEFRGQSWIRTIREQRRMVALHLKQNPSLKAKLAEFMLDGYALGRGLASDETGFPETTFPAECPWGLDEVLELEFWPE